MVDAEISAHVVLRQSHRGERDDNPDQAGKEEAAPRAGAFFPQKCQRDAAEDEAERSVDLHRDEARHNTLQRSDVETPAHEHKCAQDDDKAGSEQGGALQSHRGRGCSAVRGGVHNNPLAILISSARGSEYPFRSRWQRTF
ncbi:MAG TPA: hypothetical protein VGQ21_13410 [Thermoanaerobaculia bacterium]|nr:hypothetical protein [Thermoanaerobaculia bacterium]